VISPGEYWWEEDGEDTGTSRYYLYSNSFKLRRLLSSTNRRWSDDGADERGRFAMDDTLQHCGRRSAARDYSQSC
jgi:hypothetical protein